jgi:hypothetical protein
MLSPWRVGGLVPACDRPVGVQVEQRRTKVRRLRIGLAVLTGLVLVVTGTLGGVAAALGWDGLLSPGPGWDDRYTISSYTAAGELLDDGATLRVTEDLEVEWHEPRRGLIRTVDRSGPGGEVTVSNVDVTSRTQDDVWFETYRDDPPGSDAIHLGEEVDFRPLGDDHYRITYDLAPMVVEVDGVATMRWDTFGDQWDTLIERATVVLELPAGEHELGCVVGSAGQAFRCDGDGPTWTATDLRPGRGVTVEARLAPGTVPTDRLPAASLGTLERFTSPALRRLGLIAALTAAAGLPLLGSIGLPGTWRRREEAAHRIATTGVAYTPPRGMRPLTAATLVHGESSAADDGDLFAAWLLDAQQRHLLEMRPLEGEKTEGFRVRRPDASGSPDSEAELAALAALVPVDGWATWNEDTSASRKRAFQTAWHGLRQHHASEAGVPKHASAVRGCGPVLVIGALIGAGVLLEEIGLAALLLGGAALATAGASRWTSRTLRTPVAALDDGQLTRWREAEGLRRFVAEAHAEQISGLADDPTVALTSPFLELLPWVVAFGEGDRWADRFGPQIRAATQTAAVYAPMRSSEVRQLRSAATPASASSSSGGGSGVGSGGGGGGGSSR